MRNNEYITYDIKRHRHIITAEYMRDEYGVELAGVLDSTGDINPATLPERWLNQVSIIIHNYIYRYAKNKKITEYKLAMEDDWIDCLQEAMGQLALSLLLTNNNISLLTGISIQDGKKVGRMDIMQNVVPVNVEDILRNGGLLFRGTFYGFDYTLLEGRGVTY
jgi:hypothetical protein